MSNSPFTAIDTDQTEARAFYVRVIALAQAVFATTREANDIDRQPIVTTAHSELCQAVRTILSAVIPAHLINEVVEAGWDCDYSIIAAAESVIRDNADDARYSMDAALEGVKDGSYSLRYYSDSVNVYNEAFDLLNRTVGPK